MGAKYECWERANPFDASAAMVLVDRKRTRRDADNWRSSLDGLGRDREIRVREPLATATDAAGPFDYGDGPGAW